MTEIDLEKMKALMKLNEEYLQDFLYNKLKKYYNKIIYNKKYMIAAGEGPCCLLAHMDTVFKMPPTFFFHDQEQHILWSPQGMGADDRAGIYAILEVLEQGFRPSIIFTTGEETGGIGAKQIIEDYPNIKTIIPNLKFLIQLDRRGSQDSVFYDCDNPEFEEWINQYGFVTAQGTYTDISIIAPVWGVAAVNLSVGYLWEHQEIEILSYEHTACTIDKVIHILEDCQVDKIPKNTNYIQKIYNSTVCPICCRNKITKDSPNVSKYGLGINLVCKKCYEEYFQE